MTAAAKSLAVYQTRLPKPAGIQPESWQILCEVIFPHVKNSRSIMLAVEYCKQRKLDILKRPVNIVPMWSSELKCEVDTIWPSINETQITAARSDEWAGLDPPRYGQMVTQTFTGRRKESGDYVEAKVALTFPEWVEVTVYRLKHGQRYAFTERVFFLEAYGRSGGSSLPNATWVKRPIGQLTKVAKAAALRAAFPEEEGAYTDAEMAGGTIEDDMPEHTAAQRPKIAEVSQNAGQQLPELLTKADDETWPDWGAKLIACIRAASDQDIVEQWQALNKDTLTAMQEAVPKMHAGLLHSINKHKLTLITDNA